jgi:hypothetical protein
MFFELAREHVPQFRFDAETIQDARAWQTAAWPRVLATLGDFPAHVPLNPECMAVWEEDGLHKERWLIDVSRHISAIFIIAFPVGLAEDEKLPALLCCHGHGPHGKDPVMGNRSSAERSANIGVYNYDYGHQMAKVGYVTFAIDWIGFGERNDNNKPNFLSHNRDRDWCNLYYLHATMLGMTSLSINISHGQAAIDFASTFTQVDTARMGVMGLSGGGTMALWMGLCDDRLKAVEVICYSDLWAYFGIRDLNYCGMQVAPGLFKLVDLPELQGLLCPKPLLVDIGAYDDCFKVDTAMTCYKQVERIYTVAGGSDLLELDLFPGNHAWGGSKSKPFFKKHL